uniref:Uncharacterized protein n=1 Tax=Sphaerodactylus townsendi TaxID=933632 RepID=A0ACB8FRI4_9SAUR
MDGVGETCFDYHHSQRSFLSILQATAADSVLASTSQCEESGETVGSMETPSEQAVTDDCPSPTTQWPLSHLRQNFKEIRVAPYFSQEDLVPVDASDGNETDSDLEEGGQLQEADSEPSGKADSRQDSKAALKALEEKIAKCKRFLEKAKAKRFSAIRIPKGLSETVFATSQLNMVTAGNGNTRGNQRKAEKRRIQEEDEEADAHQDKKPCKKLSSKERRAEERQQRSKKTGVRYYDTHNVKNKNRNKKKCNTEGQRSKTKRNKGKQ